MADKSSKHYFYKKLQSFCAYRERCTFEVKKKLKELGAGVEHEAQIIKKLKKENFLDDQRFVETFVRGKLLNNNWGKIKTEIQLKQLNLPQNLIDNGLNSINDIEYQRILKNIIKKKQNQLDESNDDIKKNKIVKYCINKGFEPTIVWDMINKAL